MLIQNIRVHGCFFEQSSICLSIYLSPLSPPAHIWSISPPISSYYSFFSQSPISLLYTHPPSPTPSSSSPIPSPSPATIPLHPAVSYYSIHPTRFSFFLISSQKIDIFRQFRIWNRETGKSKDPFFVQVFQVSLLLSGWKYLLREPWNLEEPLYPSIRAL